jgi:hypothetical protein
MPYGFKEAVLEWLQEPRTRYGGSLGAEPTWPTRRDPSYAPRPLRWRQPLAAARETTFGGQPAYPPGAMFDRRGNPVQVPQHIVPPERRLPLESGAMRRPGRDPVIEALGLVHPLPSTIGRGPVMGPGPRPGGEIGRALGEMEALDGAAGGAIGELAYDPDEEGYFSNVIRDLANSGLFNAAARDTGAAKRAQEEKQYQGAIAMLGDLLGSMGFDLEEE